ncbi:hypothetical protein PENTCL1PPCAC_28091, partial [Pristionchus entomophagus]
EAFHALLTAMMHTEDELQIPFLNQYEAFPQDKKLHLLWSIYTYPGVAEEPRSLALILLRRLLSSSWVQIVSVWRYDNLTQFCNALIIAAHTEPSDIVREKLAELMGEVARRRIDVNTGAQKWTEMTQFLQFCASSDYTPLKQTALSIIADVPNVFGNATRSCVPGLKAFFERCLHDQTVRSAALKAYVSFLIECDHDFETIESLGTLTPTAIEVCVLMATTEGVDDIPLQCISSLADSLPSVLQPHLSAVISLCSQIIHNTEKEESHRHSAMDLLTFLFENAHEDPLQERWNNIV